jgi:hypothetical protein
VGAFQLNIQVSKATEIADNETRLLEVLYERLVLEPPASMWYPILQRRVETTRARAKGLSDAAGIPWSDPTVWTDPSGQTYPLSGERIRVILEKIEINKCDDAKLVHNLLHVCTRVRTEDNGIIEQRHTFPKCAPGYVLNSTATTDIIHINAEIFRGYVEDDLAVQIAASEVSRHEREAFCRYKRTFAGPTESFLRSYRPNDEPIDPEIVGGWEVWYRIERA